MGRLLRIITLASITIAAATVCSAQVVRGIVVDQTGLPLPGATVQVFDGLVLVTTVTTAGDGTFTIDAASSGGMVAASLEGFETVRVPRQAVTLGAGRGWLGGRPSRHGWVA